MAKILQFPVRNNASNTITDTQLDAYIEDPFFKNYFDTRDVDLEFKFSDLLTSFFKNVWVRRVLRGVFWGLIAYIIFH
jgi:hypothetical protein